MVEMERLVRTIEADGLIWAEKGLSIFVSH
jgi:hypothetical protein